MRIFTVYDTISAHGLNGYVRNPDNEVPDESEVKLCMIWIELYLKRTSRITSFKSNKLGSSYHLKHTVENWAKVLYKNDVVLKDDEGNIIENHCYVSNGAFIEAMKRNWYMWSVGRGGVNPIFNADYNGPSLSDPHNPKCKIIPHSEDSWRKILFPWNMK